MAICALQQHRGDRFTARIRIFFKNGERVEGCWSCTDGMVPSLYSTQKRMLLRGDGKPFWISPAHERAIKMRRVSPDLSGCWIDRKGVGGDMRY